MVASLAAEEIKNNNINENTTHISNETTNGQYQFETLLNA